MSVLLDVLNLVKEKQYLVADPVSQDAPDTRPATQLLAKKKVSFLCKQTNKQKSETELTACLVAAHFPLKICILSCFVELKNPLFNLLYVFDLV